MITFIILVAHRAASGAQNGLGYAKSRMRNVATINLAAMAMLGAILALVSPLPAWQKGLAIMAFAGSMIGVGMVDKAFAARKEGRTLPKWKADIHLWENAITGGFLIGVVLYGANILMAVLAVYPGLILHKGFVNLGSRLTFFAGRTDDASGKTYGLPSLGIKVPRLSVRARIALAILSIAAAVLAARFGWGLYFVEGKIMWR